MQLLLSVRLHQTYILYIKYIVYIFIFSYLVYFCRGFKLHITCDLYFQHLGKTTANELITSYILVAFGSIYTIEILCLIKVIIFKIIILCYVCLLCLHIS